MRTDKNYIKSLTNSELKKEWKTKGYAEFHSKEGRVSGLGWDTIDAAVNYSNYKNEMLERQLL